MVEDEDVRDGECSTPEALRGLIHKLAALLAISVFGHTSGLSPFSAIGVTHSELVGNVSMGNTGSLSGLYRLLTSLRAVASWIHGDFHAWFHQVFHLEKEEEK
ncbi:hypothetical protein MAPG_10944 [Magnaporthiopsis poae ATCC 64411]|uniref:PD-(D/E)XK nuclease-like domain-containing protein n=1 Tax=Magnaporthiopsis poae (strain ATCC 64411 / 73-15) TaxID=644358 RepID=A0A0C4EDY4_MAGP6|nr:hypothetical protein MAPG_10944 [Magnaporthiopsis poae ATCC 64411]